MYDFILTARYNLDFQSGILGHGAQCHDGDTSYEIIA